MSNVNQCDRCKSMGEDKEVVVRVSESSLRPWESMYELCGSCESQLTRFVNNEPTHATVPRKVMS
jgi:hypothetical protein